MNIIHIVKKFGKIMNKRQKVHAIILLLMMVIGAFLETLGVSLIVPLVSSITQPDSLETNSYLKVACEILNLHSDRMFIIAVIIVLIMVFIFKNIFLMIEHYFQYRFVYNNRIRIQKKLLTSYLYKPYEFFLNISSSEILQVVDHNVVYTFQMLMHVLTFCTEIIITIFLIATILIIDPVMTMMTFVILLLVMVLVLKIIKPLLRSAGMRRQRYGIEMNKWLMQMVQGIKEIKITRKEKYFLQNFADNAWGYVKAEQQYSVTGVMPRLMIESIGICAMLSSIGIMVLAGREMSTMIPSLSAFAMAAVKLIPSTNRLIFYINEIFYGEPALDKLVEILNKKEDYKEKEIGSKQLYITLKDKITISNIFYHYPNTEKNILYNAKMEIPVGSFVGIIGASGSGKTTVVDILLGLLKPQKGNVFSDGVDISSNYEEWLSHIGYIPQMIFMLEDNIRNNIAFGVPEDEIEDTKIWKALEDSQLLDFVNQLPEGLDTQIGERGIRISGGQRQRIGIARALYTNPELLIFDEATSALDNETEAAIMESIHSLYGKKTMIIIAHRLQTIKKCDIVYKVENEVISKMERQ